MKTTSLKLAMLTLGVRQADIIRRAESARTPVHAARISKIVNGKMKGTPVERSAIVRALTAAGMKAVSAWELLPTDG